jgi:hypothetical protein
MRTLKYVTELNGETFQIFPDFHAVAILAQDKSIRSWQDSLFELQPRKAFIFDDEETCKNFIANFHKVKDSYNEILPEGTVYYIVHDLTNLKKCNYADRLVSRHYNY